MEELRGMTSVITGGASGLGLGLASRLAARGSNLVVSDIEAPRLTEAEATLVGAGAQVLAVIADVTKPDQMLALADAAFARFGRVDHVFLNAGVTIRGKIWELSDPDWRWVYDVNLFGVVNGIRAFVPRLLVQGNGHVVITSSHAALVALGGIAPYVSSKQAVVSVAETLQHDLRAEGSPVRVSVVLPAGVRTRIPDSFRNRPAEYGKGNVPAEVISKSRAHLAAYGEDPEVAAETIIELAIVQGRFYVLTDSRDVDMAEAWLEGFRTGFLGHPATPGVRAR